MCDGRDLFAQTQGEEGLGGGWDQGDDSHAADSVWRQEGESLIRDYEFKDFVAAIAFVNRVADVAEEHNHHPDILIHGWNKVRLDAHDALRGQADRQRPRDGGTHRRASVPGNIPALVSAVPLMNDDDPPRSREDR